mgnify:FL=1
MFHKYYIQGLSALTMKTELTPICPLHFVIPFSVISHSQKILEFEATICINLQTHLDIEI